MDAKSIDIIHRAKILKTAGKIMDFNNTKQTFVVQGPDGALKLDEKYADL